jgi:hypothetical protein
MDALDYNPVEDDADAEETIENVVARIKARGPGRLPPPPSREVIQRLVAHVADETPMTREEELEWNRRWFGILDEMHRRDREDDIAEGRG